ncbi:MAG TPA: amino acid permease [Chlamydiales bacterium]|nr:amino acid permease [Chlamydiales bacterium]
MKESSEHVVHFEKKSLKRLLGAVDLFAVGYGDVGSSIYYALGATALYALGATPLALAIAGFVFICTGLTYSELSATFPEPGGSATFSRHAFNDLISFIAGWGLLLDYIVTIAISAFAVPPYLNGIFDFFGVPGFTDVYVHLGLTVGIIGFLFYLNLIGVKHSGRFSLYLAIITIVSQVFIILAAAILFLNLPYVFSHIRIGVAEDWSPDWWEFLKGTAMAMVAYTGIEAITQLAAETKKPGINVPRAIKWTMTTLIVLYFGISVVGLSVVDPHELGTTYLQNPIIGIVANFPIGGKLLAPWFGLIGAIILLIAANAGLIGCSRLMFSMGEYYQVPHFFYRVHPRYRTPHISLGFFAILASLIVLASRGRMLFLADLYNFGAQIAFFSAHMSLLVLRCRKPNLERPYRVPLNIPIGRGKSLPVTAMIGALATLIVWCVVVITKPEGRNLGFIWIFFGLVMYFAYRRKKHLAPMAQLQIEKIKIAEHAPMEIEHILVLARIAGNTEALQTACQLAKLFHAKVTAVHVIEIPHSLPMHAPLQSREEMGEEALKRAEAVARENHLTIQLKLIKARSIDGALLDLIDANGYDLIVLGASDEEIKHRDEFVSQANNLIKKAPCRVLFCKA